MGTSQHASLPPTHACSSDPPAPELHRTRQMHHSLPPKSPHNPQCATTYLTSVLGEDKQLQEAQTGSPGSSHAFKSSPTQPSCSACPAGWMLRAPSHQCQIDPIWEGSTSGDGWLRASLAQVLLVLLVLSPCTGIKELLC